MTILPVATLVAAKALEILLHRELSRESPTPRPILETLMLTAPTLVTEDQLLAASRAVSTINQAYGAHFFERFVEHFGHDGLSAITLDILGLACICEPIMLDYLTENQAASINPWHYGFELAAASDAALRSVLESLRGSVL